MKIEIINNIFSEYQFNKVKISNILDTIIKNENCSFSVVNIILENDEYLRNLKKDYFNQDVYTDVISFNLEDSNTPIEGEIYISLPRIIANAKKYRNSLNNEFKRIIIHGLLHLCGYNDQTVSDKKNMTNLEDYYININSGMIITYE